ncbi:MAG: helix-turn-helix domain-containing protein [Proteobacteria bacterium]|nr:helix-turn-helix domain-containing protein [Pseudomonadota bacterium]
MTYEAMDVQENLLRNDAEILEDTVTAFRSGSNMPARKRLYPVSPCDSCAAHKKAICSSLEGQALDRFRTKGRTRIIKVGEPLFFESEDIRYFYTVISGEVRLCNILEDGRRQVVGFRSCGDKVGEHFGGKYLYDAEAVCDTIVCQFPVRELEMQMQQSPEMRAKLMKIMQEEISELQQHTILLGRKTPIEKIATFLKNRASKLNLVGEENIEISLSMGRSDIADYLGLTVETVSRTISKLKAEKVIDVPSAHAVVVRDIQQLAVLADGKK